MTLKSIIIIITITIIQGCGVYSIYIKYRDLKLENVELEKDIQAITRSDFEALQIIDKDYKRIIENRLRKNGLHNYKLVYSNIDLPFVSRDVIVSSEYGNRLLFGKWTRHYGVDFIPLYQNDVTCGIDGEVIVSDYSKVYGNYVRVKNDNYILTYAHLEKTELKIGDIVSKGDFIGYTGETGEVTGMHLHFSIAEKQADGYYYSVNPFRKSTLGKIVDISKHKGWF